MAVRLPITIGFEYALHTVSASLFAVVATLVAPLMMVWLEQGRELLNIVEWAYFTGGDSAGATIPAALVSWFAFLLGLALWALANWFGSRLLLQRNLEDWLNLPGAPKSFVARWNRWFPRGLGIVGIGVIVAYWLTAQLWLAASSGLGTIAAFIAFVVWRRGYIDKKNAGKPRPIQHPILHTAERVAVWLGLAFSFVLLYGLAYSNYWLARFLDAPTILFLALASIVIFGSIVLTYLPTSYGLPSFAWLPLLVALLLGGTTLNRNHSLIPHLKNEDDCRCEKRPDARADFAEWQQMHKDGPIILVVAEGGASRSAWWTSHVLSTLDYVTDGEFSKNVFAISSVSGGSLGAAAYVGLLAEGPTAFSGAGKKLAFPTRDDCIRMRDQRAQYPMPMQAECFVGEDFLSTTLGYLFFPDLMQRFLPGRIYSWDRSLGLERTWETDWAYLFGKKGKPYFFEQPLHAIYWPTDTKDTSDFGGNLGQPTTLAEDRNRRPLPILLMNSARAGAGRSVLQAPIYVDSTELDDLFDATLRTRDLPLSALVHNSARFPLVSPGGDVSTWTGKHWDTLIDGGYFENSGAATLAELLHALQDDDDKVAANTEPGTAAAPSGPQVGTESVGSQMPEQQMRAALDVIEKARASVTLDTATLAATLAEVTAAASILAEDRRSDGFAAVRRRIRVLLIMNDPKDGKAIDAHDFKSSGIIEQEELLTPLLGLFNARSARADSSKRRLLDVLDKGQITEVFLHPAHIDPPPAMSWSMNDRSRKKMWCAVANDEIQQPLCDFVGSIGIRPEVAAECAMRLAEFRLSDCETTE